MYDRTCLQKAFEFEIAEFPLNPYREVMAINDPHSVPINGTLDLHTFRPSEIGSLIPGYLEECRKRGIYTVRIVHGKGTGTLRKGVHRVLDRLEMVESYRLCDHTSGGWGATRVWLK
jgi:dsDNA-specific endonuclease/ATPase MutS2